MRVFNGLLKPDLIARFPSGFPEQNGYSNYVSNCVGLEGVLACAALFSPDFVEHEGLVLLGVNIENDTNNISTQFGSNKEKVEQYNNLICLSEFFIQAEDEACNDDELMSSFGRTLIYYWEARLKSLFPSKVFTFLLEDGLFDEDGLCLTFFES